MCDTMNGSHQTPSSSDVCSHTVPFPFKLLLKFKAGAVKAWTPAPPSGHWAGQIAGCLGTGPKGGEFPSI